MKVADELINNMTEGNVAKYGHEYEKFKIFNLKLKLPCQQPLMLNLF